MKNLIICIAIIAIAMTSCQQKINIENEKEAILAVLNGESNEFIKYDLEGLANLHIQDETALRLEGGENVYHGWNEIKDLYQRYIDANKSFNQKNETDNWINTKENVITKVFRNTAWSLCDNIWKWDIDGEAKGFNNKQLTFFEKVDGKWKISSIAFIPILDIEKKLEISRKYHELDPGNMDEIISEDFIGRNEKSRKTWTKEQHKKILVRKSEYSNRFHFSTDRSRKLGGHKISKRYDLARKRRYH